MTSTVSPLVGVVGCDHALSMPDFRAAERVFQLMTQVSGRAGRGALSGRVVVQTYYPDHYAILAAAKHDYASFVDRELKYRRWLHYPPFGVLANLLIQSEKLEEAVAWSAELGKWFQEAAPRRRARARPLYRANRAHQGCLPLPHHSQGRLAESAERSTARRSGARRCRRRATQKPGGGCGCTAPDVSKPPAYQFREGIDAELLLAGLLRRVTSLCQVRSLRRQPVYAALCRA